MDNLANKGEIYVKLANKELGRFTLFGLLPAIEYGDVANNFSKAANCFRSDKQREKEIENRKLAIFYYLKNTDTYDALDEYNKLVELTEDYEEKIQLYLTMLQLHYDDDNFDAGEKINTNIGNLYFENSSFDKAIEFYAKVIDGTYKSKKLYENCVINTAKIHLNNNNISKAADLYQLLTNSLSGSFTLKTILCRLSLDDFIAAKCLLNIDSKISVIERDFVIKIINAYDEYNLEAFMDQVNFYEKYSFIDDTILKLLLILKHKLENNVNSILL